jgi:hypothetical protein
MSWLYKLCGIEPKYWMVVMYHPLYNYIPWKVCYSKSKWSKQAVLTNHVDWVARTDGFADERSKQFYLTETYSPTNECNWEKGDLEILNIDVR